MIMTLFRQTTPKHILSAIFIFPMQEMVLNGKVVPGHCEYIVLFSVLNQQKFFLSYECGIEF